MLMELGDKYGQDGALMGSEWQVEIRILVWSLIHAGIFVLFNVIASLIGTDMAGRLRSRILDQELTPSQREDGQVAGGIDLGRVIGSVMSLVRGGNQSSTSTRPRRSANANKGPQFNE